MSDKWPLINISSDAVNVHSKLDNVERVGKEKENMNLTLVPGDQVSSRNSVGYNCIINHLFNISKYTR